MNPRAIHQLSDELIEARKVRASIEATITIIDRVKARWNAKHKAANAEVSRLKVALDDAIVEASK